MNLIFWVNCVWKTTGGAPFIHFYIFLFNHSYWNDSVVESFRSCCSEVSCYPTLDCDLRWPAAIVVDDDDDSSSWWPVTTVESVFNPGWFSSPKSRTIGSCTLGTARRGAVLNYSKRCCANSRFDSLAIFMNLAILAVSKQRSQWVLIAQRIREL